jgi:hypothetical protein
MAKAKQAKTSRTSERKRGSGLSDRLVPDSGNGIGIYGRAGVDARDVARAFGRFAHLCASSPADRSRLTGSISASSSVAKEAMAGRENVSEMAEAWAKAMNDMVSRRMPDLISDYIIDMVSMLRDHFSDNYNGRELSQIAKFVRSQVGERLVSDSDLASSICRAREDLQRKIVSVLQSPECFDLFKKHMRSLDV